ncbi:MAG: histidinol phosphate phosphatase [Alphaproteobacteria bacterium]|nr:histidinol phosphate phosphatase [Alphaproteobacteria bacterium]
MNVCAFLPFVNDAADLATDIALRFFRQELPVEAKPDASPVTEADKNIEKCLRAEIEKRYPSHGIIGEEYGVHNENAEFVWVIDPIDGTRAFIMGKPQFGLILGLLYQGKPVLGCIHQPFTRERWIGDNEKATYNGCAIHVATPRPLGAARLCMGAPMAFSQNIDAYLALCKKAAWPQYNSDCYGYGLLAMGCTDVVVEQGLSLYDVAGVAPIVTGAGGFIGTWDLAPIDKGFSNRVVAASTKELAAEAVETFLSANKKLSRPKSATASPF